MIRIFAVLALGACFAAPLSAQTEPVRPVVQADETILRVEGTGFATAKPSRMVVTIGVVTTEDTAANALDANNRKIAPVIEALRAQGIPASDIQTSSLEVDAQYSDSDGSDAERIVGFTARNEVTVTSRDIENAGALISLLFDAGANSIDGPEFLVAKEEEEPLTRLAEANALFEARTQADSTAKALGMRVSRILLVSDSDVRFRNGSGYIVVTGSRIASTPIEPGEITVTARYDVEFALVAK